SDTDVDRYIIDGQLRQVLLSPRELDLNQLGDARGRWINPHFVYTHGYGVVMAESNQITPNGSPILFIRDAPPVITTPSLKLTRPAGVVGWDPDPYLVVGTDGRLVWVVDGYLTSDAHPYSREISMESIGSFNYIRNSVKATVDAYTGATHLYVFDPADPLIRA